MITKDKTLKENGFTLVEMAIVILILGLIVGAVFSFMDVQREADHEQITHQRQEKIAVALANYVQYQGFLPCPALASGDGDAPATANCTPSSFSGIVPFRTLGLTRQDITDGFGNPFSYSVAALAHNVTTATTTHERCRQNNLWVRTTAPVGNLSPWKARFCCQRLTAANQINVWRRQPNGSRVSAVTQQTTVNGTLAVADTGTNTVTNNNNVLTYVAYVLISHGHNGERSYQFNTNARKADVDAGDDENVNADTAATRDFMDNDRNTADGANYFDDIVLWRTQEGIMRELNNDSCVRP